MSEAKSISAIVGEQFREWREDGGLRQDEVARAAREVGLRWTRATIAAIELGSRELKLGEFAALPWLVGQFPRVQEGRFRRISGFLYSPEAALIAAVGPDSWIKLQDLRSVFDGHAVGGEGVPTSALYSRPAARREIKRRLDAEFEAELTAARKLGVDEVAITAVANRLWGRTLTQERDSRVRKEAGSDASARTLQAFRGHVTRALIAELRPYLKKRGLHGDKKK